MMYEQDDLKVRLVDLGKDEIIYCRDEQIPENILHVRKAEIYIGKYGFQYDIGGREGLYSYYYANYGDTWAFTESELKVWDDEKNGPKGTVYVVTEGTYSDYHIEKVFANKENAERYVEANGKYCSALLYRDDMEIEEFDFADRSFLNEAVKLENKIVQISYNIRGNTVSIHDHDSYNSMIKLNSEELESKKIETPSGTEYQIVFNFYIKVGAIERVGDRDKQRAHLLKIAQDRYAQYKARMEGV